MRHLLSLRLSLLAAAATSALAAQAQDAYSNIQGPVSPGAQVVSPATGPVGFQFTSRVSGRLSSVTLAIGSQNGGPYAGAGLSTAQSFTILVCADANGSIGAVLGSYAAKTKAYYAKGGLVVVPAPGATLTAGKKYWLVARSSDAVMWNYAAPQASQYGYFESYGYPVYGAAQSSAFSVQVEAKP